jgi:hypothetical protein
MKKIVIVLDRNQDPINHVFPGARRHAVVIPGGSIKIDWERNVPQQIREQATVFEVEDNDVAFAVEEITQWHPGKEVLVLGHEKVFQRMPGNLIEKKVTKEGTLPI